MKPLIFVLTLIVLVGAGCQKNADTGSQNFVEDIERELEEFIEKRKDSVEKVISSVYQGGQPGRISVNGIIVEKDSDQFLLDERLKLEQISGKNDKGQPAIVSDSQKAVLSEDAKEADLSDVTGSMSYINIGCETLSEDETKNLTEQTSAQAHDRVLFFKSKKIFFCGNHTFNKSLLFVNIKAAELVLKDATIRIEPATTGINLSAKKLVLAGQNLIEAKGSDAPTVVLPGPSIQFTVTREIHGEGTLTLRTIGGNIVPEPQTASE